MSRFQLSLAAVMGLALPAVAWQSGGRASPESAEAASGLQVTFLGNEGFLLEAEGRKVLIDALVSRSMPRYVQQDESLRKKLEGARPPFDVDLVLATHVHGDHFDARAVATYLRARPEAEFISTAQALSKLEDLPGFEALEARAHEVEPTPSESVRLPELGLTVVDMHHGMDRRPPTQNHGFVLELGGLRILHMGDTEVTAEELEKLDLGGPIDLAFVPGWYLDAQPWKGALDETVRPKRIVVMHLAPGWVEGHSTYQKESRDRVGRIRSAYPQAIVFERPLEQRRF